MAASTDYVKTVLVGGGQADDVPEFLQESPSMAYIENGRFERKDAISKTLPYERPTITGAPATKALCVTERNGAAVLLGRDGTIYEWEDGDAAWTSTDTNVIPTKNTLLTKTYGQASRMGDAATSNGYTVMAWDSITLNSGTAKPDSAVHYSVFDSSGRRVSHGRITGAYCPRVVPAFANLVTYIFYINASGTVQNVRVDLTDGSVSSATTVKSGCVLDLPWAASAAANFPTPDPNHSNNITTARESWRSSFMYDGGNCGFYDVAFDSTGLYGAILFTDSTYHLKYQRLNALGVATGSEVTLYTGASDDVPVPMAIAVSDDQYVGAVGYHYDLSSTPACTVKRYCYAPDDSPEFSDSDTVANSGVAVNATICAINGGTAGAFYYAYTQYPLEPWRMRPRYTDEIQNVQFGYISRTADISYGQYPHVRLASKGVYDNFSYSTKGYGMTVALQQFIGMDPYAEGNGQNVQVESPLWNKNSTTVLVRLLPDNGYIIESTFDPAQSKACVGSGQEQNIHLPRLEYDENSAYRMCNRVNAEPEDIGFRNTMYSDVGHEDKRKCVLNPGAAEYRFWEAALDQTIEAEEYGDLVLFNTGCPTSWDGITLMEAYPFDSPEVIWYSGAATRPNHFQYRITHAALSEWRNINMVWGYVDATNTLHRSAPSITAWVEGLGIEELSEEETSVMMYPIPLSAAHDKFTYFIEFYVGVGSNTPQLVRNGPLDTSVNQTTLPYDYFIDRTRAHGTDEEVIRRSRTVYTAGGVLAADTQPSYTDFTVASNRMFAIDGTSLIYFTKLFEANIFPEFSASLVIDLGRNRQLTAIESMDEKTLVFTKNEIFVISNTGPDNTGGNGDFFVDRVQTTVGTTRPLSLLRTPDGITFYSDQTQSFYLITRDLQLIEIGAGVRNLTKDIDDIVGSCVYSAENELRFYFTATPGDEDGEDADTSAGVPARPPTPRFRYVMPATYGCLAYNYEYKRWSVNTLPNEPRSATLLGDVPIFLQNSSTNYLYIQRNWDDDYSTAIDCAQALKIRLPWARSNSLQSYGRFRAAALLGRYLSSWTKAEGGSLAAGDLQVNLYYDYDSLTVGDTYRYRANVPGDFGTNRMQVTANPGQPKCQAMQLEIIETDTEALDEDEPSYKLGRGFSIEGIDYRYTAKRGLADKTQPQGASK